MADIVDDFLQRLAAMAPELSADVVPALEAQLRQHWGGTEPYVGKRASRNTLVMRIGAGLRERKPLGQVFQDAGVSRATGFRLLNRRS